MGAYLSKVKKTILPPDDLQDKRGLVMSLKGMPKSAQLIQ
jgi:hypothetical protein